MKCLRKNSLANKAIRFRNDFIHYDVKLYTEELKLIYCRLLKLYTRTYTHFIEKDFFLNSNNSRGYGNFMHFVDYLVPFRGNEIRKDQLDEIKREIIENQKYHFYVENGNKYNRVVYGTEKERFPELFSNERDRSVYEYKYCDDCLAKIGEYTLQYKLCS